MWRAIASVGIIVVLFSAPAFAATFTVTKTTDTADGTCDADCSLREAVIAANAALGADMIVLGAGTFTLSIAGTGEDGSLTGDLDIGDSVTIQGAGMTATIIDAAGIDRVFHVEDTPATFLDLTITGGLINGDGGGILSNIGNVTIERCSITNNTAVAGGGIESTSSSSLTIRDSAITNNVANPGDGGGIRNSTADMLIERTLISGNSALPSEEGGGISTSHNPATVTLINCTLSGNAADQGGGMAIGSGSVTMIHCTFSGNTSNSSDGIENRSGPNSLLPTNSIFDDNCSDFLNTTSGGGNIETGDTCGLTIPIDQVIVTPAALNLGPLADNGGPTLTHALLPGSVALDSALASACEAVDQRGIVRPQGPGCDVGAYEADATIPIPAVEPRFLVLLGALLSVVAIAAISLRRP